MTLYRTPAARVLMFLVLGVAVVGMLFLSGCRKKDEVFIDTNLAPDTRLTSAPGPLDQANYRVHMYWEGSDPDGYVNGFFYAWDDTIGTAWEFTSATDSLFKAVIDTAGETRRHTFYVRSVDNEGKLDPSPARIRFDAWTVVPVVDSLRRLEGPLDPTSPIYDPTAKDTVLMGTPCQFAWTGYDPDGEGAPVEFSYRLDSNPFTDWNDVTTAEVDDISSGTHFFYVKAQDETGAESFPENYKFVMNYSPDSQLILPEEESGTLTVSDGDTIWFEWELRDREELEGLEGGVVEVWIRLDRTLLLRLPLDNPGYENRWYFTSSVSPDDPHYIKSQNEPTGGNRPHTFTIYAKDVENRFETPSQNPDDREQYVFWYNYPPTTEIIQPAPMETVACWSWADSTLTPSTFTIEWDGTDVDGSIEAYQYVYDPRFWGYVSSSDNSVTYPNEQLPLVTPDGALPFTPGVHEFRVRSRDQSDCWEENYQIIQFYIGECE
ncbi:MAG: hypothetical protein GF405_08220 [Candidatus Eisenbacteria bacterium]|nr:hypothetical protein [Candidatus Eisenbacteria bacterium]